MVWRRIGALTVALLLAGCGQEGIGVYVGDDYVTTVGGGPRQAAPGEPQGCAQARARANDAALPVVDRQAAIAYAASLGC
jgi:hypothetical protein